MELISFRGTASLQANSSASRLPGDAAYQSQVPAILPEHNCFSAHVFTSQGGFRARQSVYGRVPPRKKAESAIG